MAVVAVAVWSNHTADWAVGAKIGSQRMQTSRKLIRGAWYGA